MHIYVLGVYIDTHLYVMVCDMMRSMMEKATYNSTRPPTVIYPIFLFHILLCTCHPRLYVQNNVYTRL